MLTNYHTHTTFCDGRSTPEEVVLTAIEKGFDALGFSGHGLTLFDQRYCTRDEEGYISAVTALKKKYSDRIQLYLGAEEDVLSPVDRTRYEYIIGSSHYFTARGSYYPIDSGIDYFNRCLELFEGDPLALAESYFQTFCRYLSKRRPDIIGHFDLITKFDERERPLFFEDPAYVRLSERYLLQALKSDCLFEVNTGAISRGYRTSPYPGPQLLHTLKKHGGRLVLCSDSHHKDTLDFGFTECRKMLRDVGFEYVYALYDGAWVKDYL